PEPDVVTRGEAGEGGVFRTTIDAEPIETSRWSPSSDTTYAAYVTDPSTGRTERRRFDLRATLHPIHVYVVGEPVRHPSLPSALYVSTFYADGTPASCDVTLQVDGRSVG